VTGPFPHRNGRSEEINLVNPKSLPADTHQSPRQEPRLPPGQILTEKWPVLHYGSVPKVDLATWDLRVHGLVEEPARWTYEEFQQQPRVRVHSDIHCVTRWSRYDNLWEGVSLREILGRVRPKPEARFAIIHAEQNFTSNLPLGELLHDDVLLADRHDGVPLTPEHGWPLRLVVPRRYFWKSAKWIRAIEIVPADRPGFWEQNGYHNDADPWREERFSEW
jgi:DMSO/TMAO reductase YedYZ molybdopterin-dependent catalytic subunit